MTEGIRPTLKPVPARRSDPEMDNYIEKGGQSLAAKRRRAKAPLNGNAAPANRKDGPSPNGKA